MKLRLAMVVPMLLLLAAGCRTAPVPVPAPVPAPVPVPAPAPTPAPAPPAEPVVLTLEPDSGPPGTAVTVRIRLKEPAMAWAGGDGKSWNFQLCWGRCGPHQWVQAVWPKPAPGDKYLFVAKAQVPAYINGSRLRAGTMDVLLACTTIVDPDCANQPEARARFHLTEELPGADWASLPPAETGPVPALDRGPRPAVDPNNPARRVECRSGSPNPNDPQGPPQLRVTADGGKNWEAISLKDVHLGAMAGISGCRAVALDPRGPGTYYLAGGGHRAAAGWAAFPPALYTVDGGRNWNPVPRPPGYDTAEAFLGYTMAPGGVTAWFARQDGEERPPSVAGSLTADGGKSWQTVPLSCPAGGPCVWDVPAPQYQRVTRHLIRSDDGGQSWVWAEWEGRPLQAWNRGFHSSGSSLEVAGATAGPESYYGSIPLLRSTDGGGTWRWVDVPAPPDGWGPEPDVRLEPDGALLFRSPQDVRYRLHRGEITWERL